MNPLKQIKILISILLASLTIFAAKKIYDFAAPQTKEKDCNFIYPEDLNRLVLNPHENLDILWQKGGTINDASCLNQTPIFGIVKIRNVNDIKTSIEFAKKNNLKITSSGQKHSMGGQSFSRGGLVLDMRDFNKIEINKENKTIKVESGATWQQIQKELDKQGLAVKAMQSINIFTVGGSLSVNAHGIAHNPGQLAETVKSIRIMKSDGTIVNASRTENAELFSHAIGGYGLFGVILDVELEVVDNDIYKAETNYTDYKNFTEYYKNNIENNSDIGLMFARISVSPSNYLDEIAVHTYTKTQYDGAIPPITENKHNWLNRLVINFSKTGSFGRWVRWNLEKYLEPKIHDCITRNSAMSEKEVCIVSRNHEMNDSMGYLKNNLKDTDILQEYFIPKENMVEFVDGLREITKKNDTNLLNVTIRGVSEDKITVLPYSKGDNFAFVLYFNQKLNEEDSEKLESTTKELIDLSNRLGGRFYLPYQLYYSPEQLQTAYPEAKEFFETKKKYDPNEIFSSKFYEKYNSL